MFGLISRKYHLAVVEAHREEIERLGAEKRKIGAALSEALNERDAALADLSARRAKQLANLRQNRKAA